MKRYYTYRLNDGVFVNFDAIGHVFSSKEAAIARIKECSTESGFTNFLYALVEYDETSTPNNRGKRACNCDIYKNGVMIFSWI